MIHIKSAIQPSILEAVGKCLHNVGIAPQALACHSANFKPRVVMGVIWT